MATDFVRETFLSPTSFSLSIFQVFLSLRQQRRWRWERVATKNTIFAWFAMNEWNRKWEEKSVFRSISIGFGCGNFNNVSGFGVAQILRTISVINDLRATKGAKIFLVFVAIVERGGERRGRLNIFREFSSKDVWEKIFEKTVECFGFFLVAILSSHVF